MAKVKINDKEYTIPEMSFAAVELSWPYVEEAVSTVHPVKGVKASVGVIAAGLIECGDFDPKPWGIELKNEDGFDKTTEDLHQELMAILLRSMKARDMAGVKLCLFDILEEAGFEMTVPGKLPQELVDLLAQNSPETVPDTSLNSWPPDVKAGAGELSEDIN